MKNLTFTFFAGAMSLCAFVFSAPAYGKENVNGEDLGKVVEKLYNGIELKERFKDDLRMDLSGPNQAEYLRNPPKHILIDVGRQLFIDDFLLSGTVNVYRVWHKPVKHAGNPVLWPQTDDELGLNSKLKDAPYTGGPEDRLWDPSYKPAPGCCSPGGGIWYDSARGCYRLWYKLGWNGALAIAESKDAYNWTRPKVGPRGDNCLMPGFFFDTFSVFPDYSAEDPFKAYRMFCSDGGNPGNGSEFVSEDGVKWKFLRKTGLHGDSTTMFYNPFRKKWVWSLRSFAKGQRARMYREHSDFDKGADWHFPKIEAKGNLANPEMKANWSNTQDCFNWVAVDRKDIRAVVNGERRLIFMYNFDSVAYESVMVGFNKLFSGVSNGEAGKRGLPKWTNVHFSFSRDGFHYTRAEDRTPAIPMSGWGSGEWDTGYVGPVSSGFVIKDERLLFFYTGGRGDSTQVSRPQCCLGNGMHHNMSIGIASLRRDGFASMTTDGRGSVTTRPVIFSGRHVFVNADARFGALKVAVIDEDGKAVPGFGASDCRGLGRTDSTKAEITWKGGDLSRFAGRPVRFRFDMHVASLYSFWVAKDRNGRSNGYLGGGGSGYSGLCDR